MVLLDNSSTHQGQPLQNLLEQHPRLRIEHFPSYAPDLNPDEGVWSLAKRELANSCPDDVDELMDDVIRSINDIRTSPTKLRGCIVQSDINTDDHKCSWFSFNNHWIVQCRHRLCHVVSLP